MISYQEAPTISDMRTTIERIFPATKNPTRNLRHGWILAFLLIIRLTLQRRRQNILWWWPTRGWRRSCPARWEPDSVFSQSWDGVGDIGQLSSNHAITCQPVGQGWKRHRGSQTWGQTWWPGEGNFTTVEKDFYCSLPCFASSDHKPVPTRPPWSAQWK